jgi:type IV secretion system protein TrbL
MADDGNIFSDVAKNIQDFNCDVWIGGVGRRPDLADACHKGAEVVSKEIGKATNDPAGYVANKVLDGTFNQILSSFWEGTVGVYKQFVTGWLHAGPIINPETSPAFAWGTGIVNIFTALAVTIGLIWAGIRIVWSQRGEEVRYVFASLARVIVVSGLGVSVFALLLTASDQAAAAILDSTDWGQKDTMAVLGDPGRAVAAMGAMLFLPGGIMLLVVIVQWCIMIFVSIATPILLMYWPVAEGLTFAAGGRGFSRVSKWLTAFILFKPTVAVLYGFSFEELKGGDGIGGIVTAICILIMAPFALPALLKIVNPAAAGTGADGAGAALAGMAGVAVGAVGVAAGAATGGATVAATGAAGAASAAGTGSFSAANPGPTLAESGGFSSFGGSASSGGSAPAASSDGPSGAALASTGGSSAGASGAETAPAPAPASTAGSESAAVASAPVPDSTADAGGAVAPQAPAAPAESGGGGSRLADMAHLAENHMPSSQSAEETLLDEQSLDRLY